MKNILIIMLLLSQGLIYGQTMTWIPSKHLVDKGCNDLTDCDQNIVCYKLQYTPLESGVLTSYTTGFIADCGDGETRVKINQSCRLADKSNQTEACARFGKILLNCSGNSGQVSLEKGRPIVLHQICLDAMNKKIEIMESDIVQLTVSIDKLNGEVVTEFPRYAKYMAISNSEFCDQSAPNLELKAELEVDGNVRLKWEPAKESFEGQYMVQRSFEDGEFEEIFTSPATVISAISAGKYEYLDEGIHYGGHTYRVLYLNEDQISVYSNIVDIFYKNRNHGLVIYPNPAVEAIKVYVTAPDNSVNLFITDMTGKLILRKLLATDVEHTLDLSNLLSGLYSISIKTDEQSITKKLVLID